MSNKAKKIFLLLSITVPFLFYCLYYYGMMVKNAPYKFVEFESITFEYGPGDSLVNKYNSKTGNYQYVNKRDSIVRMHLKLNNDDLLYLHRKAADLGFWDFPSLELNGSPSQATKNSLHYVIEFKYKRKTKRVLFDEAFDGNPKLKDANQRLIKEIQKVLDNEEGKQK
jgi:hypothetical protein